MLIKIQKMSNGKFSIRNTNIKKGPELFVGPVDEARDETGKWTDGGISSLGNNESKESSNLENQGSSEKSVPLAFSNPGKKQTYEQKEEMNRFVSQFSESNNSMTEEEKKSIIDYCHRHSFNNSVRNGKIGEDAKHLDSAIAKHKISSHVSVYRGIGGDLKDIGIPEGKNSIGAVFSDSAYTSTSLNAEITDQFTGGYRQKNNIFRIKLPKGTNAAYISGKGEHEILLARNSKFRITGVKKKDDRYIYDAELIQ